MSDRVYHFEDVTVDSARFQVLRAGAPLALEPKALDVLLFLIERRDRLVLKEELLEGVWRDTFVTPNALTRVIAQLRKALGDDAQEARVIETVPRKGYRFLPAVSITQSSDATAVVAPGCQRRRRHGDVNHSAGVADGRTAHRRSLSGADRLDLAAIRGAHAARRLTDLAAVDDGGWLRSRSVDLPRRTAARVHGRGKRVQRDLRATARRGQPDSGHAVTAAKTWRRSGRPTASASRITREPRAASGSFRRPAVRRQQVSPLGSEPAWSPDGSPARVLDL